MTPTLSSTPRIWSPYQTAIFSHIASSPSNLCVRAVAGSGKTTTILEGLRHIPRSGFLPPSISFLAFNKNIAETLKSRVPAGVDCSTFHALGFRALRRLLDSPRTRSRDFVDSRKCAKILYRLTSKDDPDFQPILRLVDLLKSFWPTTTTPEALASRYDLDFVEPKRALDLAFKVFSRSVSDLDSIDFSDMLFLPLQLNAPFDELDWLFVDEAQDLNSVQHEICARLGTPSTRYVFVGDPWQAIYGFRGADSESMSVLSSRFSCETLPLSVSYRCPVSVVLEAQKYITPLP